MKNDVTILIPVYNEKNHIAKAILSAISQAKFVIVSDNNSNDGTAEICKELAAKYLNLIYFEQSENIGGVKNAEFLYSKVQTPYVMNMGAHDILAENYVSELKKCLDEHSDAVMAYAPVISIGDDGSVISENLLADFAVNFSSDNMAERVLATIEMEYNFAFFGLFKSDVFFKNADFTPVAGIDHLMMSKCILDGKFIRSPNTRFYLRVPTRDETNEAYMKRLSGSNKVVDMSYMCTEQLRILNDINIDDKFYINRAKENLQKRYVKFCDSFIANKLTELRATNKKYILYGAGTDAEMILDLFSENILFIVDKDITKYNSNKHGIKIYGLDMLKIHKDEIIISQIGRYALIANELMSGSDIQKERFISLDIDLI